MAKAKDIKLNQSVPVTPINQQTNSTTTGTQNTIPTTTTTSPANTQSNTFNPQTAPLWQQALYKAKNVVEGWDKEIGKTKAGLKEEWNRGVRDKDMLNAYKPENTFEQTA